MQARGGIEVGTCTPNVT